MILLLGCVSALKIHGFSSAKIFGNFAQKEMHENGYAILMDPGLTNPQLLSQTLQEVATYYPTNQDFSYSLGNVQGRTAIAPGIKKIGGAPPQVLVSAHSEASYLDQSPRFLVFTCFTPATEGGGATPIYKISKVTEVLEGSPIGRKLLRDVMNSGVTYMRNDVSEDHPLAAGWKAVGYPTWQSRFPKKTEKEVLATLHNNGQAGYFDQNGTLHSEWMFPGFRPHPDTGNMIWFNQLYAMNGRYWRSHQDPQILNLDFSLRPLNTKVGSGEYLRDLTEEEYQLLYSAHRQVQETFEWKRGRVLFVDNFEYQHGRLPYSGNRRCAVGWGPSVGTEQVFSGKYAKSSASVTKADEPVSIIAWMKGEKSIQVCLNEKLHKQWFFATA